MELLLLGGLQNVFVQCTVKAIKEAKFSFLVLIDKLSGEVGFWEYFSLSLFCILLFVLFLIQNLVIYQSSQNEILFINH